MYWACKSNILQEKEESGDEVFFNKETKSFEVNKKRKLEDVSWWEERADGERQNKKPKVSPSSAPSTPGVCSKNFWTPD